ncbi:MAG: choice-of-anchor tandem repeat GloVer-containing protein [Candidatus Cybelea sp.]
MIRYLASASLIALLAACAGVSNGASGLPPGSSLNRALPGTALREAPRGAVTESIVYNFGTKRPDGLDPDTDLTLFHGVLYGGTYEDNVHGFRGAIYSVTTSGSEAVVQILKKKWARELGGGLALGPKASGGGMAFYAPGELNRGHLGSVLEITLSGKITVLHAFAGGSDGQEPVGTLTLVNGTFYGTTAEGGDTPGCRRKRGCGTVYSITTAGTETPIYRFTGHGDGESPAAGLLNVNGTLFGTTQSGGAYDDGTIFSVTTSGVETVLHSFGSEDGEFPESGLIELNGTLYGTTKAGGRFGGGVVYSVTPSGSVQVLHSFGGGYDGGTPLGLLNVNGVLYGATEFGGTHGQGTVYRVTTSDHERALYSFTGGADGLYPSSDLVNIKRTLYGTTSYGGSQGAGVLYAIGLAN